MLTVAQKRERQLKEEVARECAKSLYTFLRNFWSVLNHDPFIDNWHIKAICDELQRYGEQVIRQEDALPDMIINIPPGSSKSTMVSQMLQVWIWLHAPWCVMICTSYSRDLAIEHSLKAKQIFKSDLYQELFNAGYFETRFGKKITLTKDNEDDWINNFNGRRFSTGTKGRVTGSHAHIIIRDDPLNVEQAESEQLRKVTNRYNDQTLPSRKKDKKKCPTITVMQRLHEEDPTGHDLEKEGKEIYHVCLPAEESIDVKPEKYREKYIDGLLDPIRMDRQVLKTMAIDLGSYAYAGQFLQTPFPAEGGKIKKAWFNIVDIDKIPEDLTWDLWIDGAYTKETDNDPTGIVIKAFDRRTYKTYVRYATSDYMEMPDLLKRIPQLIREFELNHDSKIYIEPKASGESLRQMLLQQNPFNVIAIRNKLVQQGKVARINTAAPKVEAGRFYLVRGGWNDDYLSQIAFFPNMKHDEYCDLIGYATFQYYIRDVDDGLDYDEL